MKEQHLIKIASDFRARKSNIPLNQMELLCSVRTKQGPKDVSLREKKLMAVVPIQTKLFVSILRCQTFHRPTLHLALSSKSPTIFGYVSISKEEFIKIHIIFLMFPADKRIGGRMS